MDLTKFEPMTVSGLGEPQPLADIAALLRVELSAAHRTLLEAFDGPMMPIDGMEIRPLGKVPMISGETFSIDMIHGRNSGRYGLAAAFETYGARLVQSVPIAAAPGGDLLVMERSSGRIFFWDHEADRPEDQLDMGAVVAESFEDMVERLEMVERPPTKIRAKKVDLRF